jgi:hypothetical protein
MAFTSTKTGESVGGQRVTRGTFTSADGSTGGDIYTGLQQIEGMRLQQKGAAVVASQAVVNETFPMTGPVTIVTAVNASGYWQAFGS